MIFYHNHHCQFCDENKNRGCPHFYFHFRGDASVCSTNTPLSRGDILCAPQTHPSPITPHENKNRVAPIFIFILISFHGVVKSSRERGVFVEHTECLHGRGVCLWSTREVSPQRGMGGAKCPHIYFLMTVN